MSLELHAVCVGMVAEIAPGVRSAIGKRPVTAPSVAVGILGIEGDEQQDHRVHAGRRIHGGPEKAVYAYPHEHLPVWSELLERPCPIGLFGENLSVGGILEDEVRVGDTWQWGGVRLRVTEPRMPCYKLDVVLGRSVKRAMLHGAMTGWYLAVEEAGAAPASGTIEVLDRGDGPAIADVLRGRKPS